MLCFQSSEDTQGLCSVSLQNDNLLGCENKILELELLFTLFLTFLLLIFYGGKIDVT